VPTALNDETFLNSHKVTNQRISQLNFTSICVVHKCRPTVNRLKINIEVKLSSEP